MARVNTWLYYKEKLTRARTVLRGSLLRIHQAVSGLPPPTMAPVWAPRTVLCPERVGPEPLVTQEAELQSTETQADPKATPWVDVIRRRWYRSVWEWSDCCQEQ